mmetsp:Transcript_17272/g.39804  ORF Transcript_17272/g.39804 Transcript_17272/m.39804 type:complete len:394 (-) Transcript_17272:833-2014(-)
MTCSLLKSFVTLTICSLSLSRTVDIVSPVAGKDASVYRFNLRHALKHVKSLRNVYVICRPTDQMKSIVLQANKKYTGPGQKVILVDEAVFPFTFESIRSYLRENRPTEGFDGQPFDATVVVPDLCFPSGPKGATKEWIKRCRQPYMNETIAGGTKVMVNGHEVKVEKFDRTGWVLQQFLKMGVTRRHVPSIGEAYLVLDADTIFYQDYDPIPPDDLPSDRAYNYMPGDPRDCGNPPYFMLLDAMGIPRWGTKVRACAGRPERKCKNLQFCPIAHGMVYKREVLSAFHEHLETSVLDSFGRPVEWWQAVLQLMPAWHTSPFSEYITYYAFALAHFPETVRVYDAAQMGASEDEIPANYYMGNGLNVRWGHAHDFKKKGGRLPCSCFCRWLVTVT